MKKFLEVIILVLCISIPWVLKIDSLSLIEYPDTSLAIPLTNCEYVLKWITLEGVLIFLLSKLENSKK